MTTVNDTVRFQASRERIERVLTEVADDWRAEGITAATVDEQGEIHPDAERELLDRLLVDVDVTTAGVR